MNPLALFKFALLFLALILSACTPDRHNDGKLIIGVSIPTQREERWVRDVQVLKAEAKAHSAELLLQISDNDANRQLAQCENLLAQNIDVLILAPHDASAASIIVEKAHRVGVKVISYDRLISHSDVDLYISFDNVKVGEIQGAYLTNLVPKGVYAVLAGAPTDNNAKLFHQGALNVLKPLVDKGDVKIAMDQAVKDWQPVEAMKLIEDTLTANKNRIDAVLAPNDGTAGGAIQALAQQGLAGKIPVTGQDAEASAAKRIIEGTQAMTVFKDTRELAKAAIQAAADFEAGKDPGATSSVDNGRIKVPSFLMTPIAVDKTNIDRVLVQSGYLPREAVYGKNAQIP
ncbi:MAG: substrate-binding domain-containing protein [Desulfovibrio sp.]|nr:substrate-binding domain-containing protein [Desulfovibrio sp.]MBI4958480.1 substrate-binding domain-containing protein [Desulfovibrio sp.]